MGRIYRRPLAYVRQPPGREGPWRSERLETFLMGAIAQQPHIPTIPITWKNNEPIWLEQWPLSKIQLEAAHALVQEKLNACHIFPSISPLNTPIFVVKKKFR